MRIAGASTTSAPSSRSRAASSLACARARVTATRHAGQRPRRAQPGQLGAQRGDVADDRDRRRAGSPPRRRRRRSSPACRAPSRWPGSVPRSTTAAGSSAGRPAGDQLLGDPRQLPDAHVEDERAGERGERRPSRSRVSGFAGSSWPVTNATALAHAALRDRDAGVGRRGDAGGDARARPRTGCRRRAAPAPPRRRGRTRTGRRPSAARPAARRARARRAAR